jgi:hypothetical protein
MMRPQRVVVVLALAAALNGADMAHAQVPAQPSAQVQAPRPAAAASTDASRRAWSVSASAFGYIVPDSANYVQPTVTADRGWLHLEARYNYEDLGTGSVWFGYTFGAGERVAVEVTPMVGAVFGNTDGVAPGFRGSLSWRAVEFSTETEYVLDAADSAASFLYTWSELGLAPADWCRFGLVVQRTKVYKSEFDIQRGFYAGFSHEHADVTAYVFNPDAHPTVVLAFTVSF